MNDPFGLERFVLAQNAGNVYEQAVAELRQGRKTTHWMWFVFPQIAGLGNSPMSQRYAISSLDEARAYLRHHLLGPRLTAVSGIAAAITGSTAQQVFGGIDAQKLQSSMTLFRRAAPAEPVFPEVLDRFFGGRTDPNTDRLLGGPWTPA